MLRKTLVTLLLLGWGLLLVQCNTNVVKEDTMPYAMIVNKTGSPVGGGTGYEHIVLQKDATVVVDSLAALQNALKSAKPGDIIYIPGNVQINLSNSKISIPAGVTLASDRGYEHDPGGLIYSTNNKTNPMVNVMGSNVRISGLRIEGPDKEVGDSPYYKPLSNGIRIDGFDSLEVDNCEIYGWSYAGIDLVNSKNNYIHHNYIHHNRRTGFGYGIVHDEAATSLIEANYFQLNRHCISGSGMPGQGYIARYNYVTEASNSHSFDMHEDAEYHKNGTIYAGAYIDIYDNVFNVYDTSIKIRGIPKDSASIHDNYFLNNADIIAVRQVFHYGNMHVYNNHFSQTVHGLYVYWSGMENPYLFKQFKGSISEIALVNFYSNEKADIFKADGTNWSIYNAKQQDFDFLKNSSYTLASLHFGDFNGDKVKDVFRIGNNGWFISYSGTGSWYQPFKVPVAQGEQLQNEIKLGDFNGDGKTDVLRANGSAWTISYGGTNTPVTIRHSATPADSMLIGDFNGDGKSDILTIEPNGWYLYPSGSGNPEKINDYTQYKASNLKVGDFNGDGKSDVFVANGQEWMYSSGASKTFQKLRDSSIQNDQIRLGDLNGDGKTDILIVSVGLWGN